MLQVSVVEAVVGRDVVGMPLLVVFGRTVLAAEHRRASLRQVRNKKTKNTKQTNFFPVSTKSAAIDRTPEKRMTALENLFSSFFREKQKRTCSGVSGASWLLTTVASASASAPTKPLRLGLLCRYSYRPSATAAADAMPASENHDDSLELEI